MGSGEATRATETARFIFRVSTNTPVTGLITCVMDEVNVSMLMDPFMMVNGKMMKGANSRCVVHIQIYFIIVLQYPQHDSMKFLYF